MCTKLYTLIEYAMHLIDGDRVVYLVPPFVRFQLNWVLRTVYTIHTIYFVSFYVGMTQHHQNFFFHSDKSTVNLIVNNCVHF